MDVFLKRNSYDWWLICESVPYNYCTEGYWHTDMSLFTQRVIQFLYFISYIMSVTICIIKCIIPKLLIRFAQIQYAFVRPSYPYYICTRQKSRGSGCFAVNKS